MPKGMLELPWRASVRKEHRVRCRPSTVVAGEPVAWSVAGTWVSQFINLHGSDVEVYLQFL